jgi:hypothetical protein
MAIIRNQYAFHPIHRSKITVVYLSVKADCVKYPLPTVNEQFRFVKEVENSPHIADLCHSFFYQHSTHADQRQRYLDIAMKHIFFSVLTTLAFSYCANPTIDQTATLQCYVRLDEQQGVIKVESTMKQGTDAHPVEIPGGIQFQGKAMDLLPIQGLQYRTSYNAAFVPELKFTWTSTENKLHTLLLSPNPISEFKFASDTLPAKQPATLRWKGPALEKGETMVLIWEQKATGQTVPMEIISQGPEPKIEFPAAKLSEIGPGKWELYLVRKKLIKKDVDGIQTSSIVELYTKSRTITVR